MAREADYTLDFRGSISSIALLKMTRIFNEMKPSEIMEIMGSDPDTRNDLFKVLPESSYDVIFLDIVEEENCDYRLRIRKRY